MNKLKEMKRFEARTAQRAGIKLMVAEMKAIEKRADVASKAAERMEARRIKALADHWTDAKILRTEAKAAQRAGIKMLKAEIKAEAKIMKADMKAAAKLDRQLAKGQVSIQFVNDEHSSGESE